MTFVDSSGSVIFVAQYDVPTGPVAGTGHVCGPRRTWTVAFVCLSDSTGEVCV